MSTTQVLHQQRLERESQREIITLALLMVGAIIGTNIRAATNVQTGLLMVRAVCCFWMCPQNFSGRRPATSQSICMSIYIYTPKEKRGK